VKDEHGHAIVLGAGVSGLLSARVLSESFDLVTVLDRDVLPDGPGDRKGVPQSRHLHSLATKGSELLEYFFPGLDAELSEAGCPSVDQSLHAITDTPEGRLPRFASGVMMRAASRDLLEWRVRRRVENIPNVRFVHKMEATGLIRGSSRSIKSVAARSRDDGSETTFEANLVLDASGNASMQTGKASRFFRGGPTIRGEARSGASRGIGGQRFSSASGAIIRRRARMRSSTSPRASRVP
jgi:2-polyprenyl-6-methoxyphenol hydroxylase-like FAD-dependent oxidoreductase